MYQLLQRIPFEVVEETFFSTENILIGNNIIIICSFYDFSDYLETTC